MHAYAVNSARIIIKSSKIAFATIQQDSQHQQERRALGVAVHTNVLTISRNAVVLLKANYGLHKIAYHVESERLRYFNQIK